METKETKQEEKTRNDTKAATLVVIDRMADRLIWLEDGNVLRDTGDGPRPWKRVKAGIDPRAALNRWSENNTNWLDQHPAYAGLEAFMVANFKVQNRLLVLAALSALGNDADGLWAELVDAGIEISVQDAHELCRLYGAMQAERRERA